MSKRNKTMIILLCVILVAVLVLTGVLVVWKNSAHNKESIVPAPDQQLSVIKSEQIEGDTISSLSIAWVSGTVSFYKSQDHSIQLIERSNEIRADENKFLFKAENGRLTVEDTSSAGVQGTSPKGNLEVYLPNKLFESLDLDISVAKVYIDGFRFRDLSIKNSTGSIMMVHSAFETANVETGTGFIKLATETMPDKVNAVAHTGSIELLLPKNKGIIAAAENQNKIKSDFPITYVSESDNPNFVLNASIGEISLNKNKE